MRPVLLGLVLLTACDDGGESVADAALPPTCDLPLTFEKSPGGTLEGAGWHRVYVQGGSAEADADGRFAMSEHRSELASGDHFLLNEGALTEWLQPLSGALAGNVFVHIARTDEPGVLARYELFLLREGELHPLFSIDDDATGEMGYSPFERCVRVDALEGEALLLRVRNLAGGMFGVVIRAPDYFTWIDVELR